jgi:dTDP-4-dehydrorhamnose 3,5-epimerase
MDIRVETTPLRDLLVLHHQVAEDERGFFMEVFKADVFAQAGLPEAYPQANLSRSARGVLRGLHFQWDPPQAKLMRVARGEAFLMAVDIRKGSPTLGQWYGRRVSDKDPVQVFAPAGFARGFCALSESADIQYFVTGLWNPKGESGIRWNDPALGIAWPVAQPSLSKKDAEAQTLAEWLARPESDRFRY